jgi:hypothetical protein
MHFVFVVSVLFSYSCCPPWIWSSLVILCNHELTACIAGWMSGLSIYGMQILEK